MVFPPLYMACSNKSTLACPQAYLDIRINERKISETRKKKSSFLDDSQVTKYRGIRLNQTIFTTAE